MYVCYSCGCKINIKQLQDEVFCPKCSCKVVLKETPPTKKIVSCD